MNTPAVIFHMDLIGLCIARDLADKDITIYGLDHKRSSGTYSRFVNFQKISCSFKTSEKEKVKEQLIGLAKTIGEKSVIYATGDKDILFLTEYKKELEDYYHIPYEKEVVDSIINKWKLIQSAKKANVPVKETFLIKSQECLDKIRAKLRYPIVMKPVRSMDWSTEFTNKTGIHKIVKIDSEKELQPYYDKVRQHNPEVLLQDYIPGRDTEIRVFASIFDGERPLASFIGHKLLHYPEGITVIAEIEDNEQLKQQATSLLKEIGYKGISEVEFKRDPETGIYYLIEINPRHWNWHQLGTINGINMSYLFYNYLTGQPLESEQTKERVKWVDDRKIMEIKLDMLLGKSKISSEELKEHLSGKKKRAFFSTRDSLPFAIYLKDFTKGIVKRRYRRKINS